MVQTRSYSDTRVNIDRYFAIFDQTETLPNRPLPQRSKSGLLNPNSPDLIPNADAKSGTDEPAATSNDKVFSLKPYIRDPASQPLGQPDLTKASRALQELQTQLEVPPAAAAMPLSMQFPNPLADPTAATGFKSLKPWNRRLRTLLPVTAALLSLSLGLLRYTQIAPSCAQVPGCQGTVHTLTTMGERLSAGLSGPGPSAASSADPVKTPVETAARVSGSEPLAYVEALAQGYQAAHLTQTARTPEQWHTVIEHWQAAIAQLETLTNPDEARDKVAAKLTEYRRNLAYAQGETDPFRQAVNVAERAGILTQTAATSADWNTVISHWRFALRLMAAVPDDSPHLGVAQVKIAEYARNLTYARQQLKTSNERG